MSLVYFFKIGKTISVSKDLCEKILANDTQQIFTAVRNHGPSKTIQFIPASECFMKPFCKVTYHEKGFDVHANPAFMEKLRHEAKKIFENDELSFVEFSI